MTMLDLCLTLLFMVGAMIFIERRLRDMERQIHEMRIARIPGLLQTFSEDEVVRLAKILDREIAHIARQKMNKPNARLS